MKKKSAEPQDSKSLKTFFLYSALVCILIFVALAIKAFFIIKASTFDGTHQFIIAVVNKDQVKEVIAFQPDPPSFARVAINGVLSQDALGSTLGVIPDAYIIKSNDTSFLDNPSGRTKNMTIVDMLRLVIISKQAAPQNKTQKEIKLPMEPIVSDRAISSVFKDEAVASENVSVQIINATQTPGIGKRLERVITNMGGNVVAISTAYRKETNSTIRYYGEKTYTLEKLGRIIGFPIEKLDQEAIADIVITIGEKGEKRF